ncbi:MAG TPA: hypothetical protein VER11_16885 [Polyangiaceae bacterium]|nr:hypothetical protein [Polyangiaceae bacterium]
MRVFWVAVVCGVVLVAPSAHASPSPAGFTVALSAEYRSGWLAQEWSGFLSLNIPFERFAASRAMRAESRWAEGPPKKESDAPPGPTGPSLPPDGPAPFLSPRLARGTVRRALASAGYLEARSRLSSLATRARSSAVLPELGVRTLRSSGQLLRLAPTVDDPNRYTQAGTSELTIEARLTWHLDRLVFADEEVSLERLQIERDAAERRLIDYVLERLELWQRGRVRAADPSADPEQRETAQLSAVAAAVELDVLTDGWFSQAIGESDSGAQAKVANPPESR